MEKYQQKSEKTRIETTTDRPAPLLPGYYAIQCLSSNDVFPHVTQYHKQPEPALKWKDKMVERKIFDAFALCSSDTKWDLFNHNGKSVGSVSSIVPPKGVMHETVLPVAPDHASYVAGAREAIGANVCCLTWAEHHAHASSVGHSNMVAVARQMVMTAAAADLEHVYLVDSVESGCRVQGWFMNPDAVSQKFMNMYLDRYKWLNNGWPLANDHHVQVLVYRMATLRPLQVASIVTTAGDVVPVGEHAGLIGMRIQRARIDTILSFTASLFEGLEEAIRITSPQGLEVLDTDIIREHAERIVKLYRSTFL